VILERVLSGGQTGADQAGWRAAQAAGLATGGHMPPGFLTEAGPHPEFAERYGAVELRECGRRLSPAEGYRLRTWLNVRESDATLWFGDPASRGGRATLRACHEVRKRLMVISPGDRPSAVVAWLGVHLIRSLNVAGNRESTAPGLGERVEAFLARVFALLREG
jgi:hypothetical protein